MVLERSSPGGDSHLASLGEVKEVIFLSFNTDRGLGEEKLRKNKKKKIIIIMIIIIIIIINSKNKDQHTPLSFQSGISSERALGCITAPDKI